MNNKSFKSLSLLLATLIITGCGPSTVVTQPANNTPSTSNTSNPTTNNQTPSTEESTFILVKETAGVSNPVTPDQIEYLDLNGKKILAKDIQVVKSGDSLTDTIRFNGSGNYSFNATGNSKDILKLKIVGSSEEVVVPLFKPGQEGFKVMAVNKYAFKLVLTTDASGNVTGVKGIVEKMVDGNVSAESTNVFELSVGNFNYYQANGQSITAPLSVVVATSENLTVKPTTKNDTIAQQVNANTAKTSIDGYIGVWNYTPPVAGLAPVTLNLKKTGSKRFTVSTSIAGKTYTSSGEYPDGESPASSLNVQLSVAGESMSVKIENPSANTLNLTLLSGGPDSFAPFKNIPLTMSRSVN